MCIPVRLTAFLSGHSKTVLMSMTFLNGNSPNLFPLSFTTLHLLIDQEPLTCLRMVFSAATIVYQQSQNLDVTCLAFPGSSHVLLSVNLVHNSPSFLFLHLCRSPSLSLSPSLPSPSTSPPPLPLTKLLQLLI